MSDIDPYEILGVKEDSNPEQIRKAYKNLAKKLHPDKIGTNPRALEQMKLVNEAYALLKNKGIRKSFDGTDDWEKEATIEEREKVWREYSKQVEEYYNDLQEYLQHQLVDINIQKDKLADIEGKLRNREFKLSKKEKQLDELLLHISSAYALIVNVSKDE
ncbi:MAG: DnaJ domain-containing protein [Candidatus Thermoplasmatota archaeon]|nr:DnaJ domain-containing protein [Candidatus Thermoplasmatota archaeon]